MRKLASTIVDAHAHLGTCRVFDLRVESDTLVRNMDERGIDASIVQPFPGAYPQPPKAIHDEIARLSEKHKGRIFGISSINPHVMERDEWHGEAERCVKDLGFVGLKCHTIGHAVLPSSSDGEFIFETANRLKVPVMIHTGPGIPFSMSSQVIPIANKYRQLPLVLAHMGAQIGAPEAVHVATLLRNVCLECSWSMGGDIKWAINQIGSERVMFGSDLPNNSLTELVKATEIGLTQEQLDWYLSKAATKIFKLKM